MINDGIKRKEIVKHIEEKRKNMSVYLTVDILEYLRRGSRLSGIKLYLGLY
ncbi:MAG TPA: DegV family protein [Tissierellales bacterium]|nr:DegV family protein [Tissierellales bacterium]